MHRLARWLDILRLRIRSLFRQGRVDRELQRELQAHVDALIAEHVAAGMSPAEARVAARREFGPVASVEEHCRDTRRIAMVQNLIRDLGYAARTFARQPMLVVAATTSIGLGVGANLTIVSLANELLLSVPTAARPERLVHIRTGNGSHVSYAGWRTLDESGVLAGIAGYSLEATVNWRGQDGSVTIVPLVVTANFFDLVGMPFAHGRGFTRDEARAERNPRLVVVSHTFWRQHLGGDATVLGRSLLVNGEPYSVTGVLAPGVRSLPGYGLSPDVYLPVSRALKPDIDHPRAAIVQLVGRLQDGQSLEAARAAVSTVAAEGSRTSADPEFRTITTFAPVGGLSQVRELKDVGAFFLVLLVVAGLVLAIACANVAGLLLARSTARRREIAVRLALGASRSRLIQQLLTEGFALAFVGTLAGVALTVVIGQLLSQVSLPVPLPIDLRLSIDRRLTLVALGLVILSTLLSAAVPALQATRPTLLPAIARNEPRYRHRRLTIRGLLVMGQIAVTALLLVAAVVFLRNLTMTRAIEPGFDIDGVVVAQVTFVEGRQGTADSLTAEGLVERIRRLPGIQAAAFTHGVPLTLFSGSYHGTSFRLDDADGVVRVEFAGNQVGPGYFEAMGIPVLRGREFTRADRAGAPRVAVVNKAFADRYLAGGDPVGRRFQEANRQSGGPAEIVGVVTNGKYRTLGEAEEAAVYTPYLQRSSVERMVHVIARTSGQPETVIGTVRKAILEIDGSAAVTAEPMASALTFAFFPSRVGATLFGALGLLGTVLAATGLYGVIAFSMARRTPEIGIRMALGASRAAIARIVMKECTLLAGLGLGAGLLAAALLAGPLSAFLVPGLSPTDPLSFVGTAVLIAVVSLVAAWTPARRAIRIEPAVTLRMD